MLRASRTLSKFRHGYRLKIHALDHVTRYLLLAYSLLASLYN